MTDQSQQHFSVAPVDDYVYLKTWGPLDLNDLEAPAVAALALAKERNLDKLIDDIRKVDMSGASIVIQTKAMGILWKLRSFKRVAIIFEGDRMRTLFFSTLQILHLDGTFMGFDNEAEAIAWLHSE